MVTITIQDIQVILTQPTTQRLIVVKIITSEPGLYGLGCATFTQRFRAVHAALEHHIKPFLIGRDVSRIEEHWQMMMVNGYWRNGPVLNNAISGIDMALWDIKGKLANMPVYQLLGGKVREAAAVYTHADGSDPQQVIDEAQRHIDEGYRYVRVQMGGYGGKHARDSRPNGAQDGAYFDPRAYTRNMLKMLETVRSTLGDEIELLHDIHERLQPIDALGFAKAVEPLKLFFLEDALAPEDVEWFAHIRANCTTPLAMGELFVHPLEWRSLIEKRLIDFIRMHISAMGGITPARNAAIFAQIYGVRTAWHGPQDVSPVGHAANLHLDLWAPNFGIQEWSRFPQVVYDIFPGMPEVRNGYMYPNDRPGLGVDIDEALAAKFPVTDEIITWTQTRLPDGSPTRP
jgi:mannonate dehydratase